MVLKRILLGRALPNQMQKERQIGAFEGVPAMGLDGLGSSAYGPEAALVVLLPLGAAGLAWIGPLTALIIAVLAMLYGSYRQTIRAYPNSGGAYTVAKENLGRYPSLVAASALMIDYVLNVAVGISAGVGALVSAVPQLQPWTLWLCLGILLLVTVANLRGTLDSGRLFALPTYLFVACFLGLIALGGWHALASGGRPEAVIAPPPLAPPAAAISVWLLMHAFASGCTAMTGVEAVSNGVGAFREPRVKVAHRTLTAIVLILAVLLAGIAWLCTVYRIGAMDQTKPGYQSVLSQLAHAVAGQGVFYYVAIGSLLAVLALSANTSFTGFPRLCRMIAQDDFLPRPFAVVGRRLVYSVGILYLTVAAGALLIVFDGITERLIPLFAIGAFLTFTLSQAGMVMHWIRVRRREGAQAGDLWRLGINALGACATGVAFVIILLAKFTEGAWITIVVLVGVIVLLRAIHGYYERLTIEVHEDSPLHLADLEPPIVLVVVEDWSQLTDKAMHFAMRLSPDVCAVHLVALEGPEGEAKHEKLRAHWPRLVEAPARVAGLAPPKLLMLHAAYRRMNEPLLGLIRRIERDRPGRPVAVVVPGIVKRRWWQLMLHTHRAARLRAWLLRHGDAQTVVIDLPWYLGGMDGHSAARPMASAAA